MASRINDLVSNSLEDLSAYDSFAAIIGAEPSKGARSPILWNEAFKALELNSVMVPLDVSPDALPDLLHACAEEKKFLGGAIAAPYKEAVAQWVRTRGEHYLTPPVQDIGAVNCIFRHSDGSLCGTNTDGEAALKEIKGLVTGLSELEVLMIGLGGVGKAIAAYLVPELNSSTQLTIAARENLARQDYSSRIGARFVNWPIDGRDLAPFDLIINCTSIGWRHGPKGDLESRESSSSDFLPLAALKTGNLEISIRLIQQTKTTCAFYDAIYDPSPTAFLREAAERNRAVRDGSGMNRKQAAMAFCRAVRQSPDLPTVERLMQS